MTLRDIYRRRNYELAQDLGVTPSYLSQVFKGGEPSPMLRRIVSLLHKQNLTKSDNTTGSLSPNVEGLLSEWTSELGISRQEFVEQCLRRFGQQTHDALRNIPKGEVKKVSSSVAAILSQTNEIVKEGRERREHRRSREADEQTGHKPSPAPDAPAHSGGQPQPQDEAPGGQSYEKPSSGQYRRVKKP